jgi:hypothetical protein
MAFSWPAAIRGKWSYCSKEEPTLVTRGPKGTTQILLAAGCQPALAA